MFTSEDLFTLPYFTILRWENNRYELQSKNTKHYWRILVKNPLKQYNNGIKVVVGRKEYKVMTGDLGEVLHVFDLLNKAQDPRNNTPASKVSDAGYQYTYTRTESTRPPIDEAMARVLKDYLITNPGAIQSELYKQLPQYDKNEISNALYWWEKDGKIRREKSGRSYALYNEKL